MFENFKVQISSLVEPSRFVHKIAICHTVSSCLSLLLGIIGILSNGYHQNLIYDLEVQSHSDTSFSGAQTGRMSDERPKQHHYKQLLLAEAPKVETSKVETPEETPQAPKVETSKVETPEVPKVETPKVEVPKVETSKVEVETLEVPKVEIPKVEIPVRELGFFRYETVTPSK
jgi:hypothetical protein